MEKNKKIFLLSISSIIFILCFFLAKNFYQKDQKEKIESFSQENSSVFKRDYSVRLGTDSPKVSLVEFLDPECESCRNFAPLVKSLMNEFEGKIQLVIRYAPFHQNSELVIKILEASRKQNKYWEVLDVLFQFQPEWGSHHDPRPDLIWHYLGRTGVDVDQIKRDMTDPSIQKLIEQDKADGQSLGVTGTPTFFVNEKPLEVFGYESLREMIIKEL